MWCLLFTLAKIAWCLLGLVSFVLQSRQNFKPLAIISDCTDRFVSDLIGNSEDRFSHINEAHFFIILPLFLSFSLFLTIFS